MTIPNLPKISVVMCVYNGEAFVNRAIESILAQTYTNFEFIIVDDGSTDRTSAILDQYAASDERIVIIKNNPNIGLTKSLNTALAHVRRELIARQDADDESYPERFAQQIQAFRNHPDAGLVTSHFNIAGYQGRDYVYRQAPTEIEQRWAMLFHNHISGHSGVMLRASIIEALGGYNEDFQYAQDYELWARLIRDHPFYVIPETLFKMNFHGGNISETKQAEQLDYALQTARMQLSWLLGESLTESEVKDLHNFWVYKRDEVSDYVRLHKNLRRIWQQFSRDWRPDTEQSQRIQRKIADRFWGVSASVENHIKMHGIWYALQWDARSGLRRMIGMLKQKLSSLL